MTPFRFVRQNRNQRTILILIGIYAALIGMIILLDAVWWLMAVLALTTVPALWDFFKDTSAGMELTDDTLRWHSGQRQGELKLSEVDRFRFDTRWDFSVRVSAILKSDKRLRLPDESLPPHRQFEEVLNQAGFAVERHHFTVF
ncbi:hypothetical protein SAMN05444358_101145 [Ruegeria halocynthiae]|uniref:PH domain-containing protein n=1 Tax=Ruegeria halocynthiae TaxID=985054 RepID=A0A1H2RH56_9RHOB|nr:hypothetical protein [Ruegeria halocynthiae]SDW18134.1 hypothetical protein SAMN05444358_101145 [Ruegeria halocynthiae]